MQLVPTEEQVLLQQSARAFFREHSPVARVRTLRDTHDAQGFSRELWRQMAELGWVSLCLPEGYQGAGLGFADLCVILEEAGRQLAPEPWLSTVLLGAQALLLGGSDEQKQRYLPALARGELLLALAYEEAGTLSELGRIQTLVEGSRGELRLTGEKRHVLDAHIADVLLVFARTQAGYNLFLVDPKARGVSIERQSRIDGRNVAAVRFEQVPLSPDCALGATEQGLVLLERVLDRATVGLSAEMLGGASRAFDDTLDYLKTRKQFGVTLGSFQALSHRAARLYIELALARSAVAAAAVSIDAGAPEEAARFASLAKARCSEVFLRVVNEAIQMHGGIGVTDDFHMGFFLKRARAANVTFGDATWHLRRWASLSGY